MFILIAILFIIGVIVYNAFSYGYVASVFYGWFILPMFPNLPHFTYLQFVGITLFLIALFPKHSSSNVKSEYKDDNGLWGTFLKPWILLILGAIIHSIWF